MKETARELPPDYRYIEARYHTLSCNICYKQVYPGQIIAWSPKAGKGVMHKECFEFPEKVNRKMVRQQTRIVRG
jgi:hypothetical protein